MMLIDKGFQTWKKLTPMIKETTKVESPYKFKIELWPPDFIWCYAIEYEAIVTYGIGNESRS